MSLSDSHAIEHRFDDLAIEIAGIRIDTGICGTAVLASDPGYEFFVASIVLDGTTFEHFPKPGRLSRDRIPAVLRLDEPPSGDVSQNAVLFRILRDAIENSPEAVEAWRDEALMAAE
jgi:hypothetical protein